MATKHLLERELRLMRALDSARDESQSQSEMLRRCAALLREAADAERCEVWLQEEDGHAPQMACADLADSERALARRRRGRHQASHHAGDARDQVVLSGNVGSEHSGAAMLELRSRQGALRESLASGHTLTGADPDGGYYLIAPLRYHDRTLGAFVLVERDDAFDDEDRALLADAVAQTDSALAHALDVQELRCRRRELEAIFRIDRIRDSDQSFSAKLNQICQEMTSLLGAEIGFVALFDLAGRELDLNAAVNGTSTRTFVMDGECRALAMQLAKETIEGAALQRRNDLPAPWFGYIGVPLVLKDEIIGVFGALRGAHHRPFDTEDAVILRAVGSQADTAVFENRERVRIRQEFGRYVHPEVVNQLLRQGEAGVLEPQRRELTVLFSDIRGFTAMSEQHDAAFVVALLDEHLDAMTQVVLDGRGTVDKFVGDEVMAIFGAPLPAENHVAQAVLVAQAMQVRQRELAALWKARGWPELHIGIGINTGPMMVGNIGSERMRNYTVIGSAVNLGARLCGAAVPGQILLGQAAVAQLQATGADVPLRPLPPLSLKGITEPVPAWEVATLA